MNGPGRSMRLVPSILVASLFLAAPVLSADWYRDYDNGKGAFKKGRYAEAIRHLERAIAAGPKPGHKIVFYANRIDCYYPYYYLGLAYQKSGNPAKAYGRLRDSKRLGELSQESEKTQTRGRILQETARLAGYTGNEDPPPVDSPEEKTSRGVVAVSDSLKKRPPLDFGRYHALLIAVQDYLDHRIQDLTRPIRDAEEVAATLRSSYTFSPRDIHFLRNPNRAAIIAKLTELKRRLGPRDNLLIFYAGHGQWDEREGQGYWLPIDATEADSANWISNSDIRDKIKAFRARHTLLISDACFSGAILQTRSLSGSAKPFQELHRVPSRRAITSGTKETVPDRSVFVRYLIEALETNTSKFVQAQKLFTNLQTAVIHNSPTVQKPQYGVIHASGDKGGDFIFVRKDEN